MALLLLCVAGWLFAFGVMVLAFTYGGAAQRIVYGVAPLALSGAIVVRVCKRQGWLRCGALLLAACATDYALYLALRGHPDADVHISWDQERGVLSWGQDRFSFQPAFDTKKRWEWIR